MATDSVKALLEQLNNAAASVEFDQVMAVISEAYLYTPTRFTNGSGAGAAINEAGTNEGSCKIFAFAKLNTLPAAQTLALFGTFYRDDVLAHPDATDHANIRNFMRHGWDGIQFDGVALALK